METDSWRAGEYVTSDRQAEHMAAAAMRDMGYQDARVTPVGADGGIDVTATGAIAQVKFRGAQTGRADIQRLVGARGHDDSLRLIFFAASGYSSQAIDYAAAMDIALFVFDPLGRLEPHSPFARYLGSMIRPGSLEDSEPTEDPADASGSLQPVSPVNPPGWWKRHWLDAVVVVLWVSFVFAIPQAASGDPEITWISVLETGIVAIGFTVAWAYVRNRRSRD